ncbi:hypothetical protein ACN47E_006103 [Coniothyrium glycines]
MAGLRAWLSNLFHDSHKKAQKKSSRATGAARTSFAMEMVTVAESIPSATPITASTRPQLLRQPRRISSSHIPPQSISAIMEDEEPPEYDMLPLTRTMATPQYELPPTNLSDDAGMSTKPSRPPLTRNFSLRFSHRLSVASSQSTESDETKRFSQISTGSMDSARSSRSGRWSERMGSLTPLSIA